MGDLKDIPVSYARFLKDRTLFRENASQDPFETPGHSFFKIMFHFWNGNSDGMLIDHSGLLAPTWLEGPTEEGPTDENLYQYDSAWAYLKNNYEDERADKLEKFVNLLSTISSDCPWYFQEISGLDTALERNQVKEFKFEDERKRIQIKCLPDSYDQKIGTLLSLYRDIVWSWSMKREIIPANLRKFDMSLFIWESPIWGLHDKAVLNDNMNSDDFSASYKLIEFHNCEIDYNSLKSGLGAINNREGIQSEYTIDIMFDDCYESNYNHVLMRTIGDIVAWDTTQVLLDNIGIGSISYDWNSDNIKAITTKQGDKLEERLLISSNRPYDWYTKKVDSTYKINDGWEEVEDEVTGEKRKVEKLKELTGAGLLPEYQGRMNKGRMNKGFLENIVANATAAVTKALKTAAGRLLLGNLYTYSISKMASQLKSAMNGNVSAAIGMADEYAGTNIMNTIQNNSLNSLGNNLQGALNRHVHDRRENSSNTQLGSMPRGVEEPKPAAAKPYSSSPYDRSEPAMTLSSDMFPPDTSAQQHVSRDIFPPADPTQQHVPRDIFPSADPAQQHVQRDIFPPVKAGAKVTSLGNLNKARTLINNI
jgi:hypothetical protein